MKTYVIKDETYNVNDPSIPVCVAYWGKPRRLWDSPYYVEGFKRKKAAEKAIQIDIEGDCLLERLGTHTALENKTYIRFYSIVEEEEK